MTNDDRARRMGDLVAEIANTDPVAALKLAEEVEAIAARRRRLVRGTDELSLDVFHLDLRSR